MLNKLFKPKWQHKNPTIRQHAISRLDISDASTQGVLVTIAQNDADNTVRISAIEKLEDLNALEQLTSAPHDTIQQAASLRYAEVLANHSGLISEGEVLARLNRFNQEFILHHFIQHCADPKLLSEAILLVTDNQQLLTLATNAPTTRLRKLAAELIQRPDDLKALLNASKTKDKSVAQLVKTKLQQIKEQERTQLNINAQLSQLIDSTQQLNVSVDHHGDNAINKQFVAKLGLIKQQSSDLAAAIAQQDITAHPQIGEQRKILLDTLNLTLAQAQASADAQADTLAKEEAAQALSQARLNEQKNTLEQLQALESRLQQNSIATTPSTESDDSSAAHHCAEQLQQLKETWLQQVSVQPARQEERRLFERSLQNIEAYFSAIDRWAQASATITQLLSKNAPSSSLKQQQQWLKQATKHIKSIQWPEYSEKPDMLQQLEQKTSTTKNHINTLLQQQDTSAKQAGLQLNDLEKQLSGGLLKEASSSIEKIQTSLSKLDERHSVKLDKQLKRLQGKYKQLRDWQHFATDPKREALCEEMEALTDVDLPAASKAESIKQLQQAWKALGDSQNTRHLWTRFQKAADIAYAPCKEHFKQQQQLRQHNYEQRQLICTELKNFLTSNNWEELNNENWTGVERIVQQAANEWRNFSPVDREKHKVQQQEFNEHLEQLKTRLRDERKRNAQLKTAIIAEAIALADLQDSSSAINSVKELQQRWQNVGITYHNENQALWQQFRQACDQVFENRNQERESAKEERNQNLSNANALIQQLKQLCQADDETLLKNQAEVKRLSDEFNQLGALPKAELSRIQNNFQKAIEEFKRQVAGVDGRSRRKNLTLLRTIADQLDESEASSEHGQLTAILDAEDTKALPSAWQQAIKTRYLGLELGDSSAKQNLLTQQKNNLGTLRQYCIELEIVTSSDTPTEDQAKRMEMQMSRLSSEFGKGLQNKSATNGEAPTNTSSPLIEDMIVSWCGTGPVNISPNDTPEAGSPEYQELKQRFFTLVDRTLI
jgi:hypothetical protein